LKDLKKWVHKQWKDVSFGDKRLDSRTKIIAQACSLHPEKSIPKRFQDWAGTKAAYRFLDSNKVSHSKIQAPHYQNVLKEASISKKPIIFIQDGSELLFNSHRYTFGLGPTCDSLGKGLLFHSCLAVRYHGSDQPPEVLGLAYQKPWIRPEFDKPLDFLESTVWLDALKQIGRPPADQEWITVGDRGGDIYEFLTGACQEDWKFVIRAKHNRYILVKDKLTRLKPWVRALTGKAGKTIYKRARGTEFSGEIDLEISWGKAKIKPPLSSPHRWEKEMTFVRVHAPKKPKIEWILISNLEIEGEEDALRIIDLYRQRWLIEEYHKCLKSGCRIEESQLRQGKRILNLLGILGVVATQLLTLKEKGRMWSCSQAKGEVDENMYQIVCQQFNLTNPTLREFWRCIARLGGFLARKSDGDPGWQSIWAGLSRINDMLLGYEVLATLKNTYG